MTKKQNKCASDAFWVDAAEEFVLDASRQGPTLPDLFKVKNTPCSALFGARSAYSIRRFLRTVNQNVPIWSEQNMDRYHLNPVKSLL
jgi:hypothetical protein